MVEYFYSRDPHVPRTIEVGDYFQLESGSITFKKVNGLWFVISIAIKKLSSVDDMKIFISALNKDNRVEHFWPEIEDLKVYSRVST